MFDLIRIYRIHNLDAVLFFIGDKLQQNTETDAVASLFVLLDQFCDEDGPNLFIYGTCLEFTPTQLMTRRASTATGMSEPLKS